MPNKAARPKATPKARKATTPQSLDPSERSNEEPIGSEKKWFNPTEAMQHLGVSRTSLYKLMDDGQLPFYMVKGIRKRRIQKEDLDALMEKGVPGSVEKEDD
jgi:excisionase family DNA binding protein